MSVLIKGMDMPNGCKECHFRLSTGLGDACALLRKNISATVERGGFHSDCPLIELPPHGRLIDADALIKEVEKFAGNHWTSTTIKRAMTIIPADESDMDSFIRIFEEDDEEDGMDSFIRILKD